MRGNSNVIFRRDRAWCKTRTKGINELKWGWCDKACLHKATELSDTLKVSNPIIQSCSQKERKKEII